MPAGAGAEAGAEGAARARPAQAAAPQVNSASQRTQRRLEFRVMKELPLG
jgi:hypothetical protein